LKYPRSGFSKFLVINVKARIRTVQLVLHKAARNEQICFRTTQGLKLIELDASENEAKGISATGLAKPINTQSALV
jgi:hypothetical protein